MKYLLGFLVGFQILDGLLTYFLVREGLGQEANPFLRPLVLDGNFVLLKVCAGILAAYLLWVIYTRWPRVALGCTWFFVAFYAAIVIWNSSVFLVWG
jgi:hypothetical protein